MRVQRSHFVCLPCRTSVKKSSEPGRVRAHVCTRCGGELINAGTAFAAPRRSDTAAWRALTAVLNSGLRFHTSDCMGSGPGYRPRTPREVRTRLAHAAATGIPVAQALACPEVDAVSGVSPLL